MKQLRMVGYGRVSTDEERQLYSLEHQLRFFEEYARTRGYELVKVYADEGISGKRLKNRKEFCRMLQDAGKGLFDLVVVKDVSRFARNTVDLLTSVRDLRGMGINVLFVNNNQQTLGESEFVLTLLGAMAQEESANLSRRVQFGKDVTARQGRVPKRILGYDYVDNYHLTINREEAELIRRIYAMYHSGNYSMGTIAAVLNTEGYTTKLGCAYSEGYIRRVLTNSIYCGELVNHKTQIVDYINVVRRTVPEQERYRHVRPELAIVSREEFDAVQEIRRSRRQNGTQTECPGRHPFSGLLRCGCCGGVLRRQSVPRKGREDRDVYWRCPNAMKGSSGEASCKNRLYVPQLLLEQAFAEGIARFADEEFLCRQLSESQPEQNRHTQIDRQIDALRRQKQRWAQMYASDRLTIGELEERTKQLQTSLDRLRRERNREEQQDQIGAEELRQTVRDWLSLESMDNHSVRKLLSEIVVKPDCRIVFHFRAKL